MKDEKNIAILETEIKKRMQSDEWNINISKRVLSKRKKILKKNILTASLIPLTALIVLTLTLFPRKIKIPPISELDLFIEKQVEGTNRDVFAEYLVDNSFETTESEEILSDNIDILIDNTLAIR